MRRDELLLIDIIERCDLITEVAASKDEESFLESAIAQSAVLYGLVVIGEAVRNLSDALLSAHPTVPWNQTVAFRNLAVHAYPELDAVRVWDIVTQDVPALRSATSDILRTEFPLAAKALEQRKDEAAQ